MRHSHVPYGCSRRSNPTHRSRFRTLRPECCRCGHALFPRQRCWTHPWFCQRRPLAGSIPGIGRDFPQAAWLRTSGYQSIRACTWGSRFATHHGLPNDRVADNGHPVKGKKKPPGWHQGADCLVFDAIRYCCLSDDSQVRMHAPALHQSARAFDHASRVQRGAHAVRLARDGESHASRLQPGVHQAWAG